MRSRSFEEFARENRKTISELEARAKRAGELKTALDFYFRELNKPDLGPEARKCYEYAVGTIINYRKVEMPEIVRPYELVWITMQGSR